MTRLADCLTEYETIAVAGMCKNAGKTTAVNHIIGSFQKNFRLGLTSIGYDGEAKDEITLLEKPRVTVFPGMICATCSECLKDSYVSWKLLKKTGINTVLGEILIIEITTIGILEVSGPSVVSQLLEICLWFRKSGCEKIIVDGSAGRLSFATFLDCMVLSVGAAMSRDMNKVIKMTEHQIEMLELEVCNNNNIKGSSGEAPYVIYGRQDELIFVFRGSVTDDDLDEIMKNHRGIEKKIIANDPACLFVSSGTYRRFKNRNGQICVLKRPNLAALTINPMSPYGKWFDKDKFLHEMRQHTATPVFNVLDEED